MKNTPTQHKKRTRTKNGPRHRFNVNITQPRTRKAQISDTAASLPNKPKKVTSPLKTPRFQVWVWFVWYWVLGLVLVLVWLLLWLWYRRWLSAIWRKSAPVAVTDFGSVRSDSWQAFPVRPAAGIANAGLAFLRLPSFPIQRCA